MSITLLGSWRPKTEELQCFMDLTRDFPFSYQVLLHNLLFNLHFPKCIYAPHTYEGKV